MSIRVRFAPSPTGPLHIGGVRTALYNYLFAKKHAGVFILRVEDTDQNRFVDGAEAYITETLDWLGISPDESPNKPGTTGPYRQSERKDIYLKHAQLLVKTGNAYLAFDTADDLQNLRETAEQKGERFIYNWKNRSDLKNSLSLNAEEVATLIENKNPYVIRFKSYEKGGGGSLSMIDKIRGDVVVDTSLLDDKIIVKQDGMPTYHLANVVDDHLMEISHVIRGEEWLPSAPLHVMLYKYLGWEETMPIFAHLPLILKPDGKGKLSKRDGDRLGFPVFPIEWKAPDGEISSGYRESGYLPEAVVNMLAMLGWHPSDNKELFSLSELIQAFDLDRVSKSGAKFDMDKSKWFNHQFLLQTSPEQIINSIQDQINPIHTSKGGDYLKRVVELLKEKVNFSRELLPLGHYFFEPPVSYDEKIKNKKWNTEISSHINQYIKGIIEFNYHTADQMELYLTTYAEENGINKGMLMQPLRWAVSGQAGGPPIFDMLELIGLEEITNRINIVNTKF